jgi:hypothetical protein
MAGRIVVRPSRLLALRRGVQAGSPHHNCPRSAPLDGHRLFLLSNDPEVAIKPKNTRSLPLPTAAERCRCSLPLTTVAVR